VSKIYINILNKDYKKGALEMTDRGWAFVVMETSAEKQCVAHGIIHSKTFL
jgi:hypothetical protein